MVAADVKDPVGNTGSNSQSVGLPFEYGFDWLTVVIKLESELQLTEVMDFVADSISDCWTHHKTGIRIGRDFESYAKSTSGSRCGWNKLADGYDVIFQLSGSGLNGCGSTRGKARLFSYLHSLRAKCTRLDINADDKGCFFQYLRIWIMKAADLGQQVGFRRRVFIEEKVDEKSNKTLYMGSRESESVHRIYDKGEITRWERELKGNKSEAMFAEVCRHHNSVPSDVEYQDYMGSLLRDSIFSSVDFVERKGKNLCRAVRLSWWKWFIEEVNAQPFKLSSYRESTSLERKKAWVERSVAKALAVVRAITPDFPQFLGTIIRDGEKRITKGEMVLIESHNYEMKRERERENLPVREENGRVKWKVIRDKEGGNGSVIYDKYLSYYFKGFIPYIFRACVVIANPSMLSAFAELLSLAFLERSMDIVSDKKAAILSREIEEAYTSPKRQRNWQGAYG